MNLQLTTHVQDNVLKILAEGGVLTEDTITGKTVLCMTDKNLKECRTDRRTIERLVRLKFISYRSNTGLVRTFYITNLGREWLKDNGIC